MNESFNLNFITSPPSIQSLYSSLPSSYKNPKQRYQISTGTLPYPSQYGQPEKLSVSFPRTSTSQILMKIYRQPANSIFHPFQKLPFEVRAEIWKQVPEPREISITPIQLCHWGGEMRYSLQIRAKSITELPVVQACSEARAQVLRSYMKIKCGRGVEDSSRMSCPSWVYDTMTYIDFTRDTIIIHPQPWVSFEDVIAFMWPQFCQIRSLALGFDY
jgi:2EXR family